MNQKPRYVPMAAGYYQAMFDGYKHVKRKRTGEYGIDLYWSVKDQEGRIYNRIQRGDSQQEELLMKLPKLVGSTEPQWVKITNRTDDQGIVRDSIFWPTTLPKQQPQSPPAPAPQAYAPPQQTPYAPPQPAPQQPQPPAQVPQVFPPQGQATAPQEPGYGYSYDDDPDSIPF